MQKDHREIGSAALADPKAREFLRKADPVMAGLINARPDFRPRAWMDELPPLDAFGTLIFQVAGQQLSVRATRTIVSRIEQHFEGLVDYAFTARIEEALPGALHHEAWTERILAIDDRMISLIELDSVFPPMQQQAA